MDPRRGQFGTVLGAWSPLEDTVGAGRHSRPHQRRKKGRTPVTLGGPKVTEVRAHLDNPHSQPGKVIIPSPMIQVKGF